MSLINEALKKAHDEEMSRDAAQGRFRYPYAPLHGASRHRRRGDRKGLWLAGGVAVGLVAGAVLLLPGRGTPPAAAGESSTATAATAEDVAAEPPVAEAASVAEATPVAEAAAPAATEAVVVQETSIPGHRTGAVEDAPVSPRAAPPAEPPDRGLVLQGIFWSETYAQAMINGATKLKGDRVGDYTVVEILDHEVVLEGRGETVRLSM